jgi:hypothetical protein
MKKLKIVNNIRTIVEVPRIYNNITAFDIRFNLHSKFGFLEIIEPEINELQQIDYNLDNGIIDLERGTFTYNVIDIPQQTAQQLYDALIEQGKQVFQQFTNDLAEATLPRLIAGSVPSGLQQLSAVLQVTKTRINNALDTYLATNDIENLKAFSFETEEAEQLKQAIENFK